LNASGSTLTGRDDFRANSPRRHYGTVVEVKQGLKPFEQVALKPLELVREGVNRDKTLEPTRPR